MLTFPIVIKVFTTNYSNSGCSKRIRECWLDYFKVGWGSVIFDLNSFSFYLKANEFSTLLYVPRAVFGHLPHVAKLS